MPDDEPSPDLAGPLRLEFAGDERTVSRGLDPELLRPTPDAQRRSFTYAFLFLDEYMSEALERELTEAGAELLGPHGSAWKARVPTDAARLRALARQSHVLALTIAPADQKLDVRLRKARQQFGGELEALPVVVNAFDELALKEAMDWLRQRATIGLVDTDLHSVMAVVPIAELDNLAKLDGVLWLELSVRGRSGHDESMSVMGMDYIRPGGDRQRYSGVTTILGIIDTGFSLKSAAGQLAHRDLNKFACGLDVTSERHGVWTDEAEHGTHVLATAIGTGTAQPRYQGAAPGVGSLEAAPIRAAKVWNSNDEGTEAEELAGFDFMAAPANAACGGPKPHIVSMSGGALDNDRGTDARARKADDIVWRHRQAWVVCAGNNGPRKRTLWTPGTAKNVITVGNVEDSGEHTTRIWDTSSRGPTGDGRMKPNLVATGAWVTSAKARTRDEYTTDVGCSMATPHVSGLAATLLEHFPQFIGAPQRLRAHLMATALLHEDAGTLTNTRPDPTGARYEYGLGRASPYVAHWDRSNTDGWIANSAPRVITRDTWGYLDLDVPEGARRIVAVMTWDEPAASAGAPAAVQYDLDLWVTREPMCAPDNKGQCGEWSSRSTVDNVEFAIIDDPVPGRYRFKAANWKAPKGGIPAAIAVLIITGSMHPNMGFGATVIANPTTPNNVSVVTEVTNESWLLSGVVVAASPAENLELRSVSVTHQDAKTIDFSKRPAVSLGTIVEGSSRRATWQFELKSPQPTNLHFRALSENGGARELNLIVPAPVPPNAPPLVPAP